MTVQRGDIVLVELPFASGAGSKARPVLIVQSDHNNSRLANTIVAGITSNVTRADREPTQLLVDPVTVEGRPSGLRFASAVTCENLATIEQSRIIRKLGSLPDSLMQRVDDCIKASLGMSVSA